MENKIRKFTDLNTWKEAHKLALLVYKLTAAFPDSEKFSLVSQMRRAAISITSNIAEGFSRATYQDKSHFYIIAQGSNTELQSQILIAKDLGYISGESFKDVFEQSTVTQKLLSGLIKSSRFKIQNS